jgi:hypothetical protein
LIRANSPQRIIIRAGMTNGRASPIAEVSEHASRTLDRDWVADAVRWIEPAPKG